MRLTPAQLGLHLICGEDPRKTERLSYRERLNTGREILTNVSGKDFGYDLAAWHEHLKESRQGGYTWGRHIALPRIMKEALKSKTWCDTVRELEKETSKANLSSRRLRPGDKVVLESTDECGIVVHSWPLNGTDQDCYVAFFGDQFPSRDSFPTSKPYVLRYYSRSLRPESDDFPQAVDSDVFVFDVHEVRLLDPHKMNLQRWLVRGRALVEVRVGDTLILAGKSVEIESLSSYGKACEVLSAMMTGEITVRFPAATDHLLRLSRNKILT